MSDNEMFKTTLMGGYDKEDVGEQFRNIQDAHASECSRLKKILSEKDKDIAELTQRIEENVQQKEKLEHDIKEKYQKYIDHHDSISHLLVDAQIKANEIISDAKAKRDHIMEMTEIEIKRKHDSAQVEIDEKIAEGERKYKFIQGEMDEIRDLINQAQKRFMSSHKEIHKIINDLPK